MSIQKPAPSTKATPLAEAAGVPQHQHEHQRVEGGGLGAATGAAAGAALGAFAGPPGAIAGAVIGAIAGAATGVALAEDHDKELLDEVLDQEIGVVGEEPIGAAPKNAPKATRGTYSASSVGADTVAMTDDAPDEGPLPHGEE
jgi:phage tail tape-measure protein